MINIEALEKLHGYADVKWDPWPEPRDHLHKMLDAIEAEIADRFMELPVDAEGVPIRIGDYLHSDETNRDFPCRGCSLTILGGRKWWTIECCYDRYSGTSEYVSAKSCHHVKPRTIGVVLKELEGMRGNGATYEDVVARCSELADELRELIGCAE